MAIAKYVKATGDRKRYQIDYTDWLDTGEQVSAVVFTIEDNAASPVLVIDGIQILPSGLGVQYYINGGVTGVTYRVLADLSTTIGPQQKRDEIFVTIREP
jgi:hypothetical protein